MKVIGVRVTEETASEIEERADRLGISVSQYIRELFAEDLESDVLVGRMEKLEHRVTEIEKELDMTVEDRDS